MWLFSCDGDLFGGKRIWLRPGSTHLFGRTSSSTPAESEKLRAIDHKSVSRKHLTIGVGAVHAGDSVRLHTRSVVTLTDNSKVGTTINGEKFSQETKTLSEKEYTIKLGNYEHLFHLKWHPVVLTFGHLSKKPDKDSLGPWREKLEKVDVKLALEYVTNETTHVIAKKRNTPPSLQALLQARWLVTERFSEAFAAAAERKDGTETSLLEDDFDANWPREDTYLLPSGAEQNPRPTNYVKPNPARSELFQDFIFIFLTQSQYDTLFPVVAAGGGKALLRDGSAQSTTVSDVVEYVKEVAGRKGSGEFRLSQQTGKGGVVVVRTTSGDANTIQLNTDLDIALDQRSIEQSEFLDVILTTDTSSLRKSLEYEPATQAPSVNTRTAGAQPQNQQEEESRQQRAVTVPDSPSPATQDPPPTLQEPDDQEPPEPPATTKRRNRRIVTASRFKGFDDFDPSQFSKPVSQSPEPSASNRETSVAPSDNMDIDHPSRMQQASRKRAAPVEDEAEDREDMFASALPGYAAMKRQKMLAGKSGKNISFSKAAEQVAAEKAAKAKKKAKKIDVQAEMAARMQREEEQRRKDEELRQAGMPEISHEDAQKLLQIEEMEITERQPSARNRVAQTGGSSDRWDPAWNGRKNFKKFRRQGQRGEDAPRLQRVIVALEEVPRKGHGLGDQYWLNPSKGSNKSKSQSQSQSQSVRAGGSRSQPAADHDDDGEDHASFRHRQRRAAHDEDEQLAPMEDIDQDEIAGQARDPEIAALANINSTASQTVRSESQKKSLGKRPAAQAAAGAPAAKKTRQGRAAARTQTVDVDDEDDDDALKFRRRRR